MASIQREQFISNKGIKKETFLDTFHTTVFGGGSQATMTSILILSERFMQY